MHVVQNLKIFNDFVIGTSKVAEPYKLGERSTDVMLEILNLDKKEAIAIDEISNQEFSEVIKLDSIFFGFLLPTPIDCRKGSFFLLVGFLIIIGQWFPSQTAMMTVPSFMIIIYV